MNRQQVIELVKKSLIDAIRVTGNRGFQLSQTRCPVITGYLKSTGSNKDIDEGVSINYKAEYSSFVERGVSPGIRHIKTYRRKTGVIVKAHQFFSRGQKAQHYIESPLKEAFSQDFAKNFDSRLRSTGAKVTKV